MARPYITLGFGNTFDPDTITFFADGRYRTFRARASETLELFQYRDNKFDPFNDSADRFRSGVGRSLSSDYEVIRTGANVTIRARFDGDPIYDFGVVAFDNSAGTAVTLLEQVSSDGINAIQLTDDRTLPMDVLSLEYNQENFNPSITTNYAFGNCLDLVKTSIVVQASKPFGIMDFVFGYVDNQTDPIQTNQVTGVDEISSDNILSYETGGIQAFEINESTGIGTPKTPINFATGSISITDLGGDQYRIDHIHQIPIFTRIEDLSANVYSKPEQFEGNKSLKYIFECKTRTSAIDTIILESTSLSNAGAFFKNGNIGADGEFLNGGSKNYQLESFDWDNDENSLNYTVNTAGILQIKSNNGPFTATSQVELRIQEINDISNQELNLTENLKYESVLVNADTVPVSGTNLLNVIAEVNAVDNTLIDVTFNVLAYAYQDQYQIKAAVSNDLLTINNNSFSVIIDEADAGVDTSDWILEAYPGSAIETISINPHYDVDISNAFNNMVGMVEDRAVTRFKFVDNSTDKTITQFVISLKSRDGGDVFDTYQVTPTQINEAPTGTIDTGKGYILANGDIRNALKVSKVGNEYLFEFATQLWESMLDTDDLILSFQVLGTQTLLNGLIFNADKEWRTAILGYSNNPNPTDYTSIADYDEGRNEEVVSDPKYLFSNVSYSKFPTLETLSGISKTGITKIEAVFEPSPLVADAPVEEDLVGIISIKPCGGGQLEMRQFHSRFSPESDSPFEDWDDSGLTTFCDVVLNIGNTVSVRANLDSTKLKLAYPDANKFDISFRLDNVQQFIEPDLYYITANNRNNSVDEINFDTEALTSPSVVALFPTLDLNDYDYEIDGVNYPTVGDFESALSSIVGTKPVKITPNTNSYIDSGIIIQHQGYPGIVTDNQINFDFNAMENIPIDDIVIWFDKEIQFSSATIGSNIENNLQLSIRTEDASTEDWTVFDYDDVALQLASINSEIQSVFGINEKYAIHITSFTQGVDGVLTMPFTYSSSGNFQDLNVYWSDSGDSFEYGDCITFEDSTVSGLENYINILDTPLFDLFNWADGNPFTITFLYNNNTTDNTGRVRLISNFFGQVGILLEVENNSVWRFFFRSFTNRYGATFSYGIGGDKYATITITYDGSQDISGFKIYINGIEIQASLYTTGSLTPLIDTTPTRINIGQTPTGSQFQTHVWKVKRMSVHSSVISTEEIRRYALDMNYTSPTNLLRSYNMGVLSPTFPVNPEVIYEEVLDSNDATLINHSDNRTPF